MNPEPAAARPDDCTPLVLVAVASPALRRQLVARLAAAGLASRSYGSAAALLAQPLPDRPGCLLLELQLPDADGLALQAELAVRGNDRPVLLLSAAADLGLALAALRAGASDLLQLPLPAGTLRPRVQAAIERHAVTWRLRRQRQQTEARLATLSPRERSVAERVLAGQSSKAIARDLGISHRTVEIHRSRLMEKLGSSSVVELVRQLASLDGSCLAPPARLVPVHADVRAVLERMAQRAHQLTHASSSGVVLVEHDTLVYRPLGIAADLPGIPLDRSASLTAHALRAGVALLSADIEQDPRVDRHAARLVGARSMMVAPLRAGPRLLGVLCVSSEKHSGFGQRELTHLQILVDSFGMAVELATPG